jgi:hypothetical protein
MGNVKEGWVRGEVDVFFKGYHSLVQCGGQYFLNFFGSAISVCKFLETPVEQWNVEELKLLYVV